MIGIAGEVAHLAVFAAGSPASAFDVGGINALVGELGGVYTGLSDAALATAKSSSRVPALEHALAHSLAVHNVIVVDTAKRVHSMFSKGSAPKTLVTTVAQSSRRKHDDHGSVPLPFELLIVVAGQRLPPIDKIHLGRLHPYRSASLLHSLQPWTHRFAMGNTTATDVLARTVRAFHQGHRRRAEQIARRRASS